LLRVLSPPKPPQEVATDDQVAGRLLGPEVQAALDGRYGAATRVFPDSPSTVILYIAIPIRVEGVVEGAVVVSQSTTRIMSALYAVRLDVFKVFLASLGVAVVLTLLMATTIASPLARLRKRAEEILDRRGRLRGGFEPSGRTDEIGDLERALAELTRRLEEHLRYTESFAADLSHEFKNPLAAIRTAADVALDVEDPGDRHRFLTMIQRDVARMERLLTEAREISRIDARLEEEDLEAVALDQLLTGLIESFKLRHGDTGLMFDLAVNDTYVTVLASADRLTQVFENLIENAVSFSPSRGTITVAISSTPSSAEATVSDEGPGIPEEHRNRIFSRFFSYRPDNDVGQAHSGLGLALVKAIVDGYGGKVETRKSNAGGAEFFVTLPRQR
jgi:two-component system sensor histidine kinase ChvG